MELDPHPLSGLAEVDASLNYVVKPAWGIALHSELHHMPPCIVGGILE